jgi:hypothetical protein
MAQPHLGDKKRQKAATNLSQFAAICRPLTARCRANRLSIVWLAARRQGRVVPTSTCDYAGCAKAGWRLRFCAVLSPPLVLNGVESINAFQHEISCWPVHGKKTLRKVKGWGVRAKSIRIGCQATVSKLSRQ